MSNSLKRATEIRQVRAAAKRSISQSLTPWADCATIVRDPHDDLAGMRVWELLRAIPRVGDGTVDMLMAGAGVTVEAGTIRLRELGPIQAERLVAVLLSHARRRDELVEVAA